MAESELIVGIDLGTTHSEIAAFVDGRPQVLGPGRSKMLVSCVGLAPSGELLVGEAARNQLLVYPERTVRSIKRKMGSGETVRLGDRSFTPPEISALLLRELAEWARQELKRPVRKAVITVPAYFSDAQRQATREAGELAGLEVLRILNEPTAASLAYGFGDTTHRTVLVYDLGGGTFDVSLVSIEGDVTEVLASHGNNQLGGDDFDQLILDWLLRSFQERHGVDLQDDPAAHSRLRWAAEEAKKRLSFEPSVVIREDGLATQDGKPLHLEVELDRTAYEEMIRPLVESTLDSVTRAMEDADKTPAGIDEVLLVGGSTRTPLVEQVLAERFGFSPRQDIHPELCVALGVGLLASRLAGHDVEKILVDISPYSFGISYLGTLDGRIYEYCYRPIIQRNTPLPITRTESYSTTSPYQEEAEINIFQGEDPDALKNVPVGNFRVEGLTPMDEPNEVRCRMNLDLNGILQVTAIEKCTGKSKQVTIKNALKPRTPEEIAAARAALEELFASRAEPEEAPAADAPEMAGNVVPFPVRARVHGEPGVAGHEAGGQGLAVVPDSDPAMEQAIREAETLMERARSRLPEVHEDDGVEIEGICEGMEPAIEERDAAALRALTDQLKELLFFIVGKS